MTEEFASSVSMDAYGVTGDIRLVDLYDSSVYALPEEAASYDGGVARLRNLPLRDHPMLVMFGDFARTEAAGRK